MYQQSSKFKLYRKRFSTHTAKQSSTAHYYAPPLYFKNIETQTKTSYIHISTMNYLNSTNIQPNPLYASHLPQSSFDQPNHHSNIAPFLLNHNGSIEYLHIPSVYKNTEELSSILSPPIKKSTIRKRNPTKRSKLTRTERRHWDDIENCRYQAFLTKYPIQHDSWVSKSRKHKRKNYYIEMSRFIITRTPSQCRSHDQKHRYKYLQLPPVTPSSDQISWDDQETASISHMTSEMQSNTPCTDIFTDNLEVSKSAKGEGGFAEHLVHREKADVDIYFAGYENQVKGDFNTSERRQDETEMNMKTNNDNEILLLGHIDKIKQQRAAELCCLVSWLRENSNLETRKEAGIQNEEQHFWQQ